MLKVTLRKLIKGKQYYTFKLYFPDENLLCHHASSKLVFNMASKNLNQKPKKTFDISEAFVLVNSHQLLFTGSVTEAFGMNSMLMYIELNFVTEAK